MFDHGRRHARFLHRGDLHARVTGGCQKTLDFMNMPGDLNEFLSAAVNLDVTACHALHLGMHGGHDRPAVRSEHRRNLKEELLRACHVIEHEARHDPVKAAGRKWERNGGSLDKEEVLASSNTLAGSREHVGREVDRHNAVLETAQLTEVPTGAAANVENPTSRK